MLTIQPGFLFSSETVSWARASGLTDDDVAADIEFYARSYAKTAACLALIRYGRPPHYVADIHEIAEAM